MAPWRTISPRKLRLFDNQTVEDTAILNWDDEVCRSLMPILKAKLFPFSMKEKLAFGVYLDAETDQLVYARRSGNGFNAILLASEMGIPGQL